MNMKRNGFSTLLLILMLLLAIPAFSFAETADVQEIQVGNTPIKGQILLEKTGLQLVGVNHLGEPELESKPLKGAVFEVRADENIVGMDGKKWYAAGELVATMTTSDEAITQSPLIPLGRYTIQEITAPSGYVLDKNTYTVEIKTDHHDTPVITATVQSVNDPTEILLQKNDRNGAALAGAEFGLFDANDVQVAAAISDENGLVRFLLVPHGEYTIRETSAVSGYLLSHSAIPVTVTQNWQNTGKPIAAITNQPKQIRFLKVDTSGKPMAGITFMLINAETNAIAETVISDDHGAFTFTNFDYGTWIVREAAAPEGYSKMDDYIFEVGSDWTAPNAVMLVNVPDHYEFIKTDSNGMPLAGVKFALEDQAGTVLGEYESDKNGIVRISGLKPGVYFIKETATLKGYSLSGDVRKLTIDKFYIIPDTMPTWVNYTTIQTGVNIAITGVMWIGVALMIISITSGIIRKSQRSRK